MLTTSVNPGRTLTDGHRLRSARPLTADEEPAHAWPSDHACQVDRCHMSFRARQVYPDTVILLSAEAVPR